ncbi:uncharacterized protein MYCFIDRAFT_205582 [Pseudocercospora fijiensis CIRAD86]|uniref:Uncharacterized protein n=1 Tax=Pseudocercospora fijiensis (strain CIRAD86) TaxID=383855 RepID=M2YG29_PSEFD|nr:uncharacterized protein MYCFIDRAFT_205582 [Pseudocercospora fijiensis CIRAD86]EME76755.1 hypothetical protein MYCFIDRAFT_205582 [Pseudocercospora fijiensis CIRAD86]
MKIGSLRLNTTQQKTSLRNPPSSACKHYQPAGSNCKTLAMSAPTSRLALVPPEDRNTRANEQIEHTRTYIVKLCDDNDDFRRRCEAKITKLALEEGVWTSCCIA